MSGGLAAAITAGIGFVTVMISLLTWLNTRKSTKSKGDGEAVTVWRSFMGGALKDATEIAEGIKKDRDRLEKIRGMLIDLVQALILSLKRLRAPSGEVDSYQDRLDDIRRL